MKESKQPPSKGPIVGSSAATYGLVEEDYADNPFQLLVVCIFLNKTKGERAIPQARRFLREYPDPESLSKASYEDIQPFFANLGLSRRANWLVSLAEQWLINPPTAGVVHKKPSRDGQVLESEVAHLKGIGQYASDAWRIFCKDDLYRRAGHDNIDPEWKKVTPKDKELVEYLKWRRTKEEANSGLLSRPKQTVEDASDAVTAQLNQLCIGDKKVSVNVSDVVQVSYNDRKNTAIPRRIILKGQTLRVQD